MPVNQQFNEQLIEQRIESQLMTSGAYYPLEWLIDNGYLPYDRYEAWRMGEYQDLDECFSLPLEHVREYLKAGIHYAEKRSLISEPETFYSWQSGQHNQTLRLSGAQDVNTFLGTRWVRQDQGVPQLDLFMDNPVVVIENDIVSALTQRQWDRGQQHIDKLYQQDSGNPHLSHYDDLVAYGRYMDTPPSDDLDELYEEVEGLEQDMIPMVRDCLKQGARDYLAPAWRRIAQALSAFPMMANGHAKLHPSYAQAQIPLWPEVVNSIENTPDYTQDSYLLERLASAQWMMGQHEAHMLTWCLLFWLFDEEAVPLLIDALTHEREHRIDPRLRRAWNQFEDSDFNEPAKLFASWLMIQEPGLVHHVGTHTIYEQMGQGHELAQVYQLICAEHTSASSTKPALDLREQLKHSNGLLLDVYLKKHGQ